MTAERYYFLGFPVPLVTAKHMAERLTFRDLLAPIGAQHVVRRRTEQSVPVRSAS